MLFSSALWRPTRWCLDRSSGRQWAAKQSRDCYVAQARHGGYVARSAFKLTAIDDRFHLLTNDRHPIRAAMDLGCSPGSWCQVIRERCGDACEIYALDLLPVRASVTNATFLQGDFTDPAVQRTILSRLQSGGGGGGRRGQTELGKEAEVEPPPSSSSSSSLLDLVTSDMCPNRMGGMADRQRQAALQRAALAFSIPLLRPGGHFICKVLGSRTSHAALWQLMEQWFRRVSTIKPLASRAGSDEAFLVGRDKLLVPRPPGAQTATQRRARFGLDDWPGLSRIPYSSSSYRGGRRMVYVAVYSSGVHNLTTFKSDLPSSRTRKRIDFRFDGFFSFFVSFRLLHFSSFVCLISVGDLYLPLYSSAWRSIAPNAKNKGMSLIGGETVRAALYQESMDNPNLFWSNVAKNNFHWEELWDSDENVCTYNFDKREGPIFVKWFEGGMTNVCYNAIDRHLPALKDKVCFHFEGNDPNCTATITYGDMYEEIIKMGNVLRSQYGIQKGDVVALYLPMIPFTMVTMMACARIGAIPTVIFSGFSSRALADRIVSSEAKLVVTADASFRATKPIFLKKIVDEALALTRSSTTRTVSCLVYPNAQRQHCVMTEERDTWYDDAVANLTMEQLQVCPIEWVDAEHTLFILYTSGSTGKPKAVVHTTGGYMVYSATTFRYVFDYHPEDVYFCTGDVGWITGHSYAVYGPMLNGATSVLFEGIFNHPTLSRWWELVEKYKVSIFYTAPTAIRALMKFGDEPIKKHNLSTLRVLGSVGEPINVEAWEWYYEVIGGKHVDIVDTWWQTESGGHMITPIPGCTPMKPGSASVPFFGVSPVLLDPTSLEEKCGEGDGLVALDRPWPGIARTLLGDHGMYEKIYFSSNGYYLSGDGARRDEDGYFFITGRVDDVLNVSGHRLSTSEIEDAATSHEAVVECAAVGFPHDVKGEAIYLFLSFHQEVEVTPALLNEIKARLQPAPQGLPKTRSGKIVRRILRKIASKLEHEVTDTSTLFNPGVVQTLIEARDKWVK
eukprot:gene6537-4713_t